MSQPEIEPRLSVVVGLIAGGRDDLAGCLASLAAQEGAPPCEIIVPWDDPCADVVGLSSDHPAVRFVHAAGLDTAAARAGASREHHDTLRTIGIRAARAPFVALTEDHARVSPTWCADMVRLLEEHERAAAVGGAVECAGDRLLQRAVYWCDFGRYENPLPEGPAEFVSDSNVAYRREALDAVADAWADDYHETAVHWALAQRGYELRLTPRSVVQQARQGLTLGAALRERFVWARSFAGTRVADASPLRRAVLVLASFVLPFLLTARLVKGRLDRRRGGLRFVAALPLVFLLQTVWAFGEMIGYLTADPGRA